MKNRTKSRILELTFQLQKEDNANRFCIYFNTKDAKTQELRGLLAGVGCFGFYCTNSGDYMIGVSQIVAYVAGYWRAYERGFVAPGDKYHVHHIDGRVQNNHPSNLVLLSVDDHTAVTKLQNGMLDVGAYNPDKCAGLKTEFNSQGRKVNNHLMFIKQVAARTLKGSARWIHKTKQCVKQVVNWVNKVLRHCKSEMELQYEIHKAIPTDKLTSSDKMTLMILESEMSRRRQR